MEKILKANFANKNSIARQLARNVFLFANESFGNKIKEIIYAELIKKYFTKAEVLALYLHNLRMSQDTSTSGLIGGANYYFSKTIVDVTFAEALFLFGIIPNAPAFELHVLINNDTTFFRFQNTHGRLLDYFRIVHKSFGPTYLNSPEKISLQDAISVMQNYNFFNHNDFTNQQQAAFEIRAALVINDLYTLLKNKKFTAPKNLVTD